MTTWVALFRGINVGGNNPLLMRDLRTALQGLGCADVRTYIQSGNAVFAHPAVKPTALARKIESAVLSEFGIATTVHVLSVDEFDSAAAANPFAAAGNDPKTVHLFFLAEPPAAPKLDALHDISAPGETFELAGSTFYLHAPDGIARSKLAARAEKLLGVDATARNWRTVTKILEMAKVIAD